MASDHLEALQQDGYAIVDVTALVDLSGLQEHFRGTGFEEAPTFSASVALPDAGLRRDHDRFLRLSVRPAVDHLFPNRRCVMAGYAVRGTTSSAVTDPVVGPDEVLPFHQDLTFTDEREFRTALIWIPLVDVVAGTGALKVVPGSHRWSSGIRPAGGSIPATYAHQEAFERQSVSLEVRLGSAVVWDTALVHGSGPNRSGSLRPAVTTLLAPAGADVVVFYHGPSDALLGYHLAADFLDDDRPLVDPPARAPEVEPWDAPVTAEDFEAHLR